MAVELKRVNSKTNPGRRLKEGNMNFIKLIKLNGLAKLWLSRGKVNALNGEVVAELRNTLLALENDPPTRAIILSGSGKFFSFGFDIPEFFSFSKDDFRNFLRQFTGLYYYMFLYPKPIVAALNGHAIAGGCMLALSCDERLMVSGKAKISLNEIGFGSSVFAGSAEMLKYCVGGENASKILYSGALFNAGEAKALGLVGEVVPEKNLDAMATEIASNLGNKSNRAFASIKSLLRKSIAEKMKEKEEDSISEFIDIWYSESTRRNLENIKIY